jgi:hypothetical protein
MYVPNHCPLSKVEIMLQHFGSWFYRHFQDLISETVTYEAAIIDVP